MSFQLHILNTTPLPRARPAPRCAASMLVGLSAAFALALVIMWIGGAL